jgi:hypothetical protein
MQPQSSPSTVQVRDYALLALLTSLMGTAALVFYYRQSAILLYGDAVAHINIARRVLDSRTPGLFQLGTVWLPLPHVLDLPFVANNWLWRSGVGAAIPSMIAYVAGALGVFRLVCGMASRRAAWIAAAIFALNPNLIYMQSTAMTEPLYLALFVWTAVYFAEFAREAKDDPGRGRRSLEKCAMVVSAAMLVRYDGWFLAAVVAVAAFAAVWKIRLTAWPVRRGLIKFLLLTGATAGLWLAYNHAAYANALEFANGPYSAHAIQERTRTATMPTYPGENSARVATQYFLKTVRLNMGQGEAEYLLLTAGLIALLAMIYFDRRFWTWALLWAPVPFYVVMMAWGSVPIYLPEWWPFSYYNVRYGLQLLPAVAVFVALGCEFLSKLVSPRLVAGAAVVAVAISYSSVWQSKPICLREAQANGKVRMEFDRLLAAELKKLPPSATIMMDCGAHSGAIQLAGIPFRRVLRESNPPYWEIALSQPAFSADYVVALENDDVWRSVRLFPQGLDEVATVSTRGGPKAFIFYSAPRRSAR